MVKTIKLMPGDSIIAVVPEFCSGPGWTNTPVWVYIERKDKTLRTECIQPEERTQEMQTLFGIGASVTAALRQAVLSKKWSSHD